MTRLNKFIAKEFLSFNGVMVDPRYRFRNSTLVSEKWLAITPDEEKLLKKILSDSESKRRHADRSREYRRTNGAVPISEIKSIAKSKYEKTVEMLANGKTWSEIAAEVGFKSNDSARVSFNKAKARLDKAKKP